MRTKEELTAMSHEELVKIVMEKETTIEYYMISNESLKRALTGLCVNLEALSDFIKKNI